MVKILFLAPYPLGKAPSQRFRFEQYLPALAAKNIEYKFQSFLDDKGWEVLYAEGKTIAKILSVFRGFIRRIFILFSLFKYDKVFLHREASPIGPPIFEWLIAKVFRKPIVYDFDDAIWIPHISKMNSLASSLRWHSKVKNICKWAEKVSCGNQFLTDFAANYNANAILMPTTIDMINVHNLKKDYSVKNDKLIIGWTGTHSTMGYMDDLIPVLQDLEKEYSFEFRVISDKKPAYDLKSLNFVKWKKNSEIEDLVQFDVGVMPMKDDVWAEGKCGFKALQYMALGIVPLVSPKGVNSTIVNDKVNGFICKTTDEWKEAIISIMNAQVDLQTIGTNAIEFVRNKYSTSANEPLFLSLLEIDHAQA